MSQDFALPRRELDLSLLDRLAGRQNHSEDPLTVVSSADRHRADLDLPPSTVWSEDLDLVVCHGNASELPCKLTPYCRHILRSDDVRERLSPEIAERLARSFVLPGDEPVTVRNQARDIDLRERLLERNRKPDCCSLRDCLAITAYREERFGTVATG
jgi:hypothetical protein